MAKPTYTDPWYSKPGFLYFIGAGNPLKAIKIGVAIKSGFTQRLRHPQSANHEPLQVLGVIEFSGQDIGMRQAEILERELHKKFHNHQRFLNGWVGSEWFNPAEEILIFMQENASPCEAHNLSATVAKLGPGLCV